MPRAGYKKAEPVIPSNQIPLKFTTFNVIGFLNGKNVAANFAKSDAQGWWAKRSTEEEWTSHREQKRQRMMVGSEAEIDDLADREVTGNADHDVEGSAGQKRINVLKKAPAGMLKSFETREEEDSDVVEDPLYNTIVIHPGSSWLRIGRASDAFPLTVPNVIARKSRSASVPSTSTQNGEQTSNKDTMQVASTLGVDAVPDAIRGGIELTNDEQQQQQGLEKNAVDASVPIDTLSAKISSVRGDLRVRMRTFKLRGQGNGNSQAASYNAQSTPEPTPDYNDPGEIEWTPVDGPDAKDVYVGWKALKLPDPEGNGYTLRRPYEKGTFNTTGYNSSQELLGDIEHIWMESLDELNVNKADLKNCSAILIIPDLYDHVYVREMTYVILKIMGFKQVCLQQESVCATFGAGLSNACVIDIGAKKTSITCVEEGLVLPETRMLLDFAGDDITQFLHVLLRRSNFPYAEADLAKWHDWTVLQDLKERIVVLSEADVGLNLYDFYVRRPDKATLKYLMRVYDDVILAPYALFAPRVVDFDSKPNPGSLFSSEVDDILEIGGNAITNAMRSSTRHLLPLPTIPALALPPLPDTSSNIASPTSIALELETASPIGASVVQSAPSPLPPSLATPSGRASPGLGFELLPVSNGTAALSKSGTRAPSPAKDEGTAFDVKLEASKIPLDIAVVESILAAGTEDRMKKICQSILVVGGTGLIHNIGFAIESRVGPALAREAPALAGQTAIVPAPREIDPRILAWKGISVLSKLDCANDLWIRGEDWDDLGLRSVKERAFYFA